MVPGVNYDSIGALIWAAITAGAGERGRAAVDRVADVAADRADPRVVSTGDQLYSSEFPQYRGFRDDGYLLRQQHDRQFDAVAIGLQRC